MDRLKIVVLVSPQLSHPAGRCLRLVLQEPHLIAAAVRLERRVVAAAEVLLALEGRRLPQSTRQAQGLCAVLALACEAPELSVNERRSGVTLARTLLRFHLLGGGAYSA